MCQNKGLYIDRAASFVLGVPPTRAAIGLVYTRVLQSAQHACRRARKANVATAGGGWSQPGGFSSRETHGFTYVLRQEQPERNSHIRICLYERVEACGV